MSQIQEIEEEYLNVKDVAEILGVSYVTMMRYIKKGITPPHFQVVPHGVIRWRKEDIDQWMNQISATHPSR